VLTVADIERRLEQLEEHQSGKRVAAVTGVILYYDKITPGNWTSAGPRAHQLTMATLASLTARLEKLEQQAEQTTASRNYVVLWVRTR
jgi:hypothetical protein